MKRHPKKSVAVGLAVLIVIAVIAGLIIALGGHTKKTGPTGAQNSAAKQQIEANWKTFFAAATPLQTRESLLENGSQFSQAIESEFQALGSQKSAAAVTNVSLTSSAAANVTYNVLLNGNAVLSNQQGKAVLSAGKWKVSEGTFCQLLKMGGSEPAACKNITNS